MAIVITEPQRRFLEGRRVARLATAGADGRPHVIPICYAFDGESLFSPIDEKPKRVEPARLRRVRNIGENPQVALVVDDYSEDWTRLAYLLLRGTAEIVSGGPIHARAVQLLRDKYDQYRTMALEEKPVVKIIPSSITVWGSIE